MRKFKHVFNLAFYTPKWWERTLLSLLRTKEHQCGSCIVLYKAFFNRIYVVAVFYIVSAKESVEMPEDRAWYN